MAQSERKPTVLIVEDNEQNLELLKIYMEDVPEAEVITAGNGIEALAAVPGPAAALANCRSRPMDARLAG